MCTNVHACVHTHDTHIHAHTHTHTHTHTDWACTMCSDFGLLFLTLYSQSMYMRKNTLAHCYVNSPYTIFVTNTYTHTYTHTHMCTHTRTCTHTDWACNACSDFGFLFLTLSLQSVHVHECTHMCTQTHTLGLYHLLRLWVTLFSQIVHVHECTPVHTHTHKHTHTQTERACTTCSDIGSYFSHKVYMCMSVHACAHTHIHAHTHTHTPTHTHSHRLGLYHLQ